MNERVFFRSGARANQLVSTLADDPHSRAEERDDVSRAARERGEGPHSGAVGADGGASTQQCSDAVDGAELGGDEESGPAAAVARVNNGAAAQQLVDVGRVAFPRDKHEHGEIYLILLRATVGELPRAREAAGSRRPHEAPATAVR